MDWLLLVTTIIVGVVNVEKIEIANKELCEIARQAILSQPPKKASSYFAVCIRTR